MNLATIFLFVQVSKLIKVKFVSTFIIVNVCYGITKKKSTLMFDDFYFDINILTSEPRNALAEVVKAYSKTRGMDDVWV